MSQHHPGKSDRRSSERIMLPADMAVYLETSFNDAKVKLLVEDISTGGALLMAPDICLSLHSAQRLQGALILPDGSAKVDVIVRWQLWPRVGVQFEGVSSKASALLSKFVESLRVKA
jgi:hypothetical protein